MARLNNRSKPVYAVLLGLISMQPALAVGPMEGFPDAIVASKQAYERQLRNASASVRTVPFHLIVPSLQRWEPGQSVRVAFRGGNDALYEAIAGEANRWVKQGGANLKFQFKDAQGQYLSWSPGDKQHAADIRISFQSGAMGGYWSHVGTNSTNIELLGGKPGEASMNLDGFQNAKPSDWSAIVIHEFGHALGFEHEHQNPAGGCDFRFQDDPGYLATRDARGMFLPDAQGRRPGLYTLLGGYPNYWSEGRVDFNLGQIQTTSAYLRGKFDVASVMKYHFDASMFQLGENSPCYSPSENFTLSAGDIEGFKLAYPYSSEGIKGILNQKMEILRELEKATLRSAPVSGEVERQLMRLRQRE